MTDSGRYNLESKFGSEYAKATVPVKSIIFRIENIAP